MVKHSGGLLSKTVKTLKNSSSKIAKSEAGKVLQKHQDEKH
ncbi:hypothetical protein [Jeotgalibacillus proteolyticus]|nr:hypothetical protein [Jeotgalibacillus proteolyticus]